MMLNAVLNWFFIQSYGLLGISLSTSVMVCIITLCYGIKLPKAIQPRRWYVGWTAFGLSLLTAISFEYNGAPKQLWDEELWMAALSCILILIWAVRKAPTPKTEAV